MNADLSPLTLEIAKIINAVNKEMKNQTFFWTKTIVFKLKEPEQITTFKAANPKGI